MTVEVLFNYEDNGRYPQHKYNKSRFGQYNSCLFHKYKFFQLRASDTMYERFEFILNKCIYIKLI